MPANARRPWGVLVLFCAGLAGCGPRLIQDYTVRQDELFFVVQQGKSYSVGDCKRKPSGELSDCKNYEVDFR